MMTGSFNEVDTIYNLSEMFLGAKIYANKKNNNQANMNVRWLPKILGSPPPHLKYLVRFWAHFLQPKLYRAGQFICTVRLCDRPFHAAYYPITRIVQFNTNIRPVLPTDTLTPHHYGLSYPQTPSLPTIMACPTQTPSLPTIMACPTHRHP